MLPLKLFGNLIPDPWTEATTLTYIHKYFIFLLVTVILRQRLLLLVIRILPLFILGRQLSLTITLRQVLLLSLMKILSIFTLWGQSYVSQSPLGGGNLRKNRPASDRLTETPSCIVNRYPVCNTETDRRDRQTDRQTDRGLVRRREGEVEERQWREKWKCEWRTG